MITELCVNRAYLLGYLYMNVSMSSATAVRQSRDITEKLNAKVCICYENAIVIEHGVVKLL